MTDDDAWLGPQDADAPSPYAEQPIQQIDFDLNCVRCGYNLRGMTADSRCPECGEPVETTLRPDLLHMARPAWLGKLRKGSNWLIAAIIMNLMVIPIGMVIGVATVASSVGQGGSLPTVAMVALGLLGLVIALTYGVAVWLITEPEYPHEHDAFENHTSRLLARWLIAPAMLVGLAVDLFNTNPHTLMMYVGAAIDFIGSVILLVGFLAGMCYLRLLADRIPEPGLAKQTVTVYWGYLVTMSITLLFGAGFTLFAMANSNSMASSSGMGAIGALGLLMCPVGLALITFVIWWIVLMFRYRTRFIQAHEIAIGQQHAASSAPAS